MWRPHPSSAACNIFQPLRVAFYNSTPRPNEIALGRPLLL